MLVILAQNFLPYGIVLTPHPEDSKLGLGEAICTPRGEILQQQDKATSPYPPAYSLCC